MTNGFLEMYERYRDDFGWSLEIYNSSIMDWCINLGYKTTNSKHGQYIIHIQHHDFSLCMATAEVEIKEWLSENNGGY